MPMDAHGQRWNLRKLSIQKVADPSAINLQLAAETCEFSQVPSLSMGHHFYEFSTCDPRHTPRDMLNNEATR